MSGTPSDVPTTSGPLPPPPPPAPGTGVGARPRRRVLRGVVIGFAVLLVLAGGFGVVEAATRRTVESDASFPAAQVGRLQVDIEAGDVEIVTGDVDEVLVVTRTVSSVFGDADAVASGDGGVLDLTGRCRGWVGSCSVSYRITLPAGTAVPVELQATAGDLTASGLGSDVVARTTAGDVTLTSFRGGEADVRTTAGDVSVDAVEAPALVEARTTAGDVTIVVPEGDYQVDVDTTAGDQNLEIGDTAGASHRIVARTTAGDVTVTGR